MSPVPLDRPPYYDKISPAIDVIASREAAQP
jgi:hypothetical protein